MSALRLALSLALCACLAVSIRGGDPTSACYTPVPTADGPFVSDAGFWDINGLQSYYSSSYQVLCAYRGYYLSGPAGTNVLQWGPWHGYPNDTNCDGPTLIQYADTTERGRPGSGLYATRKNSATGGSVVTSFRINGWCNSNASSAICAGNCPGSINYDAQQAALLKDPSYQVFYDSSQPGQPGADPNLITTTNSTQYVSGAVAQSYPPYKTTNMSAITSVQLCYGQEAIACSTP